MDEARRLRPHRARLDRERPHLRESNACGSLDAELGGGAQGELALPDERPAGDQRAQEFIESGVGPTGGFCGPGSEGPEWIAAGAGSEAIDTTRAASGL